MIEECCCCAEKRCTFHVRKKIWELNTNLHCSICGTCLTMEEQKNMLKKINLSRIVNSHLDKKYRVEIARYAGLSEQELLPVWKERLAAGDIYGLYWVLLTNRRLSEETFNLVVGEVHMMSH